ncbi:LysR family transcriptional regulator [Vibrio albus]|uniref:LysR family transcriptional regulator n=1 Tax=Vibrio albus TaxID=2200953 RepID=A0A2U3B8S3_9VIBR|nr:LysR family transcriptional regulator [Vibrio albus]PWI33206.1 LysR family transcriptional regulator [Vibrio albus]
MDKLKAIHYFIATVEYGGFSAAAKKFSVPASSVSRRISDLEKLLGAQLINRTTRHINLTEIGELYYQQVKRLSQLEKDSEELIRTYQKEPSGTLFISSVTGFGQTYLIPVIDEFQEKYPNVRIRLDLNDTLTKVPDGNVDIAIRAGFAPDERIVAVKLMSNEFIPVASPGYLSQYGKPENSEEIKSHHGLFYLSANGPIRWWSYIDNNWQEVSARERLATNSGPWLIQKAIAGEGIAMLPRWSVKQAIKEGQLVELSLNQPTSVSPDKTNAVYLLYRQQAYNNPKIQAAVDFIRHRLGDA